MARSSTSTESRRKRNFIEIPFLSDSEKGYWVQFAPFPVTVREFAKFVDANGYVEKLFWSPQGWAWRVSQRVEQPTYWMDPDFHKPTYPVTGVSFWEAEAYAAFMDCALPTEAEWHLVATNNGLSATPWGTTCPEPSTEGHAHLPFFGEFAPTRPCSVVNSRKGGSEIGIRDLVGNTSEWVCVSEPLNDPGFGVLRGGSWWQPPGATDSTFWDVVPLAVRDNQTGIRLVRRSAIAVPARPPLRSEARHETQASHRVLPAIKRPTTPFRQEGIPDEAALTEWRLKVLGIGLDKVHSFSIEQLRDLSTTNMEGHFVCVCRWAEHNRFRGIRLPTLLEACDFTPGRRRHLFVLQRSLAGPSKDREGNPLVYETTIRFDQANESLLAFEMDGEPLSPELGAPLRLINFDLYGYKGVKCLSEIVITDQLERGWWEKKCNYDLEGTIRPGTVTIIGEAPRKFEIRQNGRILDIAD